jgi:hypothetical protein
MELRRQIETLERALGRLGVRFVEEELPEEAHIDGGLCSVDGEWVLYLSPNAPPWRRAEVLLDALRRLPHRKIWLPPEIRKLLKTQSFVDRPVRLVALQGASRDSDAKEGGR